eukprot:TRINITY_DN3155_c1_g4_i1.p1 TRINITY_DN3155_c1_g4~~TRINITY_DN3155_c1_g4_i1.p1  ORF type:complete len:279 (+),score=69.43 TRINITY_DN3155_c1_g4_i1:1368-2204(+)
MRMVLKIQEHLKGLFADCTWKVIHLRNKILKPCIGCTNCILHDKQCHLKDDFEEICQEISNCDGLILASPVHVHSCTSFFHILASRMAKYWHRPFLRGTPFHVVVSTGGAYEKDVALWMQEQGERWGGYSCGFTIFKMLDENNFDSDNLNNFVFALTHPKEEYKISARAQQDFRIISCVFSRTSPIDCEYYVNEGICDEDGNLLKPYLFQANLGIFRRFKAWFVYQIVNISTRNLRQTPRIEKAFELYKNAKNMKEKDELFQEQEEVVVEIEDVDSEI